VAATQVDYAGDELTLFAAATNWKGYMRSALAPHIRGDVAEVGAGLGATCKALAGTSGIDSWTCIEPDPAMAEMLKGEVGKMSHPYPMNVHAGVLADMPPAQRYDTILYIDVLEHIDDDRAEVREATARLKPGGRLVVLCPAWQFLYTPFDKAIGHYRRHTKASLRRTANGDLTERSAFYMDSVGMMASVANKLALRQSMPTLGQIKLWDRWMVPASRAIDPLIGRSFGKSVILVWSKD
jgi:SAM-dependent methyltransferase